MSIRKGSMITMLLSFIAASTVVAGNDSMKKTTETATGKFEKGTVARGRLWGEGGAAEFQALQGADCHRGYRGGRVLSGRGVPPALLQEKPDSLSVLSERVRSGPAAPGAVGGRGRPLSKVLWGGRT